MNLREDPNYKTISRSSTLYEGISMKCVSMIKAKP